MDIDIVNQIWYTNNFVDRNASKTRFARQNDPNYLCIYGLFLNLSNLDMQCIKR